MKGIVLVATLMAALVVRTFGGVPSVVRFTVDNDDNQRRIEPNTFQFHNCLPAAQEIAVINSLSFEPDPLVLPGPLTVSFNVDIKSEVKTPLKAEVYLARKLGSSWIKIPCIASIGSCTYDDLCQNLSGISSCPPQFVSAHVPCKCPFNKLFILRVTKVCTMQGNYTLPSATFQVNVPLFPAGDYHGQANLTMNGQKVGCYDIMASFG